MKHYISGLLFVLLLAACNSKSENSPKPSVDYNKEIGTNSNDVYTVTMPDEVKANWESYVQQTLSLQEKQGLKGFEIVKVTSGDPAVGDYHMLVCRTADGITKVAALLELKGDKFYFQEATADGGSYKILICKGDCSQGCNPVLQVKDNIRYLNCSDCVDCQKTEGELN